MESTESAGKLANVVGKPLLLVNMGRLGLQYGRLRNFLKIGVQIVMTDYEKQIKTIT